MNIQTQLFARKYGTTEYTLLDLYGTEPIKMNLRVQDVIEPTLAVSSYSQTFRIPHTSANGNFFQSVFNVNQTFFDAGKKAQAYINDNGSFYTNGNLTLRNVFLNDKTGKIEYEVIFMSETSDFSTQIGIASTGNGGYLTDLNLERYQHQTNYFNVTSSWGQNLFDGDVIYPLVEWGYSYTGSGNTTTPDIPTISLASNKSFTGTANALLLTQLKPSLRVKAVWDSIFENTEYTYESDFLGTNTTGPQFQPASAKEFMSMYIVSDSIARPQLTASVGFSGINSFVSLQPNNATPTVLSLTENYDYGNNYDPNNLIFTIPLNGDYTFRFTGTWDVQEGSNLFGGNARLIFYCLDANNSNLNPFNPTIVSLGQNTTFDINSGLSGQFTVDVTLNNISAGTRIIFAANLVNVNPPFIGAFPSLYLTPVTVTTSSTPAGVNPKDALPSNIKQIDFIRSIIQKFKLVFEPSKTKSKHFIITPWKDWIQQGITKDWSDKLNGNLDNKISPLFLTQPRFNTYKTEEDTDYINYNYQQTWKQTYGQRNLDSQIEVITGSKDIKDIFASLPIAPIGVGATASFFLQNKADIFLIPHIAKDEVTNDGPGKRTPIQPKLRIGYYTKENGLVNSSVTWYLDNNGTPEPQNRHPLISSFYPTPYQTGTFLIDWKEVQGGNPLFGEPNYLPWNPYASGTGPNGGITNPGGTGATDNFNRFWSQWYYSCYGNTNPTTTNKDYSFLYDAEFILDYTDIQDLRFNDKIFIKDAYYLVNSINDYVIGETSSSKVTLFKINNLGIGLPNLLTLRTDICYNAETLCGAQCCTTPSIFTSVYTSNSGTLEIGNLIFLDSKGSAIAPPGYYAYEEEVYTVGDNGQITDINSFGSPGCTCIPPLFESVLCSFPVTSNNQCDVCCCQDETSVSVWTEDGTPWYEAIIFYGDSAGTTFADPLWYSDGTNFVRVGANGLSLTSGSCDVCNCNVYNTFPHVLCFAATRCDAVCCLDNDAPTYYTDNAVFENSTEIYINSIADPAPNGFYFNGEYVAEVSGSPGTGIISNISLADSSPSCTPCANEGLDVYFDFFSEVNGTGAFQIEKSFDGVNWLNYYNKDISTIPAQTQFNYTGAASTGTFVKGKLIYGNAHDTGTFKTTIYNTGASLNLQNTVRFTDYQFYPNLPTIFGREYEFAVNLTGSNLNCGLTGASAVTCTESSCIIDETNSVYNVFSDLEVCCDPLFITDTGEAFVDNSTFYIDSTCETPPPPTVCSECGDILSDSFSGNSYHAYSPYYICDSLAITNISINWVVNDRPNRFTWYDNSGLLSTTGWAGYATYPGPWGASLNTPGNGTLTAPYTTGQNMYLLVEAGPGDSLSPISDSWTVAITCPAITCYDYENISGFNWLGNYQSCDGTWYYSATLFPTQSVCAIQGTPFTLSGSDLQPQTQCNI